MLRVLDPLNATGIGPSQCYGYWTLSMLRVLDPLNATGDGTWAGPFILLLYMLGTLKCKFLSYLGISSFVTSYALLGNTDLNH